MFGRLGLGGASVETLVQEAGISRATFYRHHDSREAFFGALARSETDRLLATLESALDPGRAVEELVAGVAADRDYWRMVVQQARSNQADALLCLRDLERALARALCGRDVAPDPLFENGLAALVLSFVLDGDVSDSIDVVQRRASRAALRCVEERPPLRSPGLGAAS